ncbi:MAG: DUF2971 domain-containing protein [Negativicutes bacterium]|nr:DUF2971 domain-containing protein [Negativicutes bacterium]
MSLNEKEFYTQQNEKAKAHDSYYHFTNLETLAHIVSDRSIRLSQLKKFNDPIEEERALPLYKNKVFTLCFTHHSTETIPMWKIYANDKMGLSLRFDHLDFLEDKNNYLAIEKGWEVRDVKLLDVLYDDDLSKFEFNARKDGEDSGDAVYSTCIGFAKTKIWEYEQETRLRCYIDVGKGKPSVSISKSKSGISRKYNYPNFDYIFCTLPPQVLHEMKVVFNPFMDSVRKDIVKATVKMFLPDYPNHNFLNSRLEGRIR